MNENADDHEEDGRTMVLSEKKAGFDPRCHLEARSTVPTHSAVKYSAMSSALQLKCITS